MDITYKQIEAANKALSAVDIKGKDYIQVNQRIKAFRMVYPTGFITTEILSNENGVVIMRSECGYYENGQRVVLGSGMAFEVQNSSYINKTSFIENCESSSCGRALGMAGFGVDASLASAEEVANAQLQQATQAPTKPVKAPAANNENNFTCANCGGVFNDIRTAKATKEKYNKYICPACIEAKRAALKKA